MRKLYSTDASEYQEMPLGVVFPKSDADVREIILFANENRLGIIPRTAGTSLAGQVVGNGLVVDLSWHFGRILEINRETRRVRVQPGVVRNELNFELAKHGLVFGPETSTANRAMIGGMVGNNSCGSNSIVYGSTREHLVSVRGLFSDGSEGGQPVGTVYQCSETPLKSQLQSWLFQPFIIVSVHSVSGTPGPTAIFSI